MLLERRLEVDGTEQGTVDRDPDAVRLASLVMQYYDALPKRQRSIFELVDLQGMTPAEVARQLGMEQVTVRAYLFKARRAIRARMLEQHERMLKEYQS